MLKLKKLLIVLFTVIALLTMTGCWSSTKPSPKPIPPSATLVPCGEVTARAERSMGALVESYLSLLNKYGQCAVRHNELVAFHAQSAKMR